MDNRYLCRGKRTDNGEWAEGYLFFSWERAYILWGTVNGVPDMTEVDPSTICRCSGLPDRNGKLIRENDIIMCHGNRENLAKTVFGKYYVVDTETGEKIDCGIGWHNEVLPAYVFPDPMPLTNEYIAAYEMEVIGNIFDNSELLKPADNDTAQPGLMPAT